MDSLVEHDDNLFPLLDAGTLGALSCCSAAWRHTVLASCCWRQLYAMAYGSGDRCAFDAGGAPAGWHARMAWRHRIGANWGSDADGEGTSPATALVAAGCCDGGVEAIALRLCRGGELACAVGSRDHTVRVLRGAHPGAAARADVLRQHTAPVWCCAWWPVNASDEAAGSAMEPLPPPLLLSGGADATIRAWHEEEQVSVFDADGGGHVDSVFCLCPLGGQSQLLASGGWDGELLLSRLEVQDGVGAGADTGGEGASLSQGVVRLRRVARGLGSNGRQAHMDAVWRLARGGGARGESMLASGGWDGRLCAWDISGALNAGGAPQLLATAELDNSGPVVDLTASPFGDELLSLSRDGSVRSWDPRCAAMGAALDPAWGRVAGGTHRPWECTRVACVGSEATPARYVVTGHESGQILLWDRRKSSAGGAAQPLCELGAAASGASVSSPARKPRLRRVGCGDANSQACVALCFDARAPWQLLSGHFNGELRQYDFR